VELLKVVCFNQLKAQKQRSKAFLYCVVKDHLLFLKESERESALLLVVIGWTLEILIHIICHICLPYKRLVVKCLLLDFDPFIGLYSAMFNNADLPFVAACNRTYYGEVGGTYSISVHRPSSRESQLPYVCQLTFAAGGTRFGDLVQVKQKKM